MLNHFIKSNTVAYKKNPVYVCTHCSAQYARKSFYLQHIEKCSTSSQANPISRSNRRRDIVIDEVDEEEFDLSDLSVAFTQFLITGLVIILNYEVLVLKF